MVVNLLWSYWNNKKNNMIIIYAFACLSLSFIKCNDLFENNICEIFDDKNNHYIENIFIYFHNLSSSNREAIIYEIIMFYKSEFCNGSIMLYFT